MARYTNLPAEQVFNPNSYPEYSYVHRRDYESLVMRKLDSPYPAIIQISGPSKTGKTVLAKYCLRALTYKQIWLKGQFIKSEDNFWQALTDGLKVKEVTSKLQFTGKLGVPKIGEGGATYETSTKTSINISRIVEQLIKQQPILVIDDFHMISQEVRTEIIRAVKGLTEYTDTGENRGLKVLILLVPTREIHTANIWREIQGRVTIVQLSLWKPDELMKIVSQQFDPYGPQPLGTFDMAVECYGLPYIMQMICLDYWYKYLQGVVIPGQILKIDPEALERVLKSTGTSLWFQGDMQTYEALTKFGRSRNTARLERKDGSTGNINQIILHALTTSWLSATDDIIVDNQIRFDLDMIMRRLKKVVSERSFKMISESSVEKALIAMHKEAEKQYHLELKSKHDYTVDPILEYAERSGILTVFSPSFLVSLRHSDEHQSQFRQVESHSS
jgi:hypothetical protein